MVYLLLPSGHMTTKWRHNDVDATSLRGIDVSTTSLRCHVPAGLLLPDGIFLHAQTNGLETFCLKPNSNTS